MLEKRQLMIVGGMDGSFKGQNASYLFDLSKLKMEEKQPMKVARLFPNGGVFYSKGFIYAIGGNKRGICERYNVNSDYWEAIPSYTDISSQSDLYSWAICMTSIN